MEQATVVKTHLSATGLGQGDIMYVCWFEHSEVTKGFCSLFRRPAVL